MAPRHPLKHSLVQLIKLAEMSTRNRLEQELRPFRLSSGQLLILVRLERDGEITPAELARGLYQTLEKRGLLQRRVDDTNNRRVLLSLTPHAKELLEKVRVHIEPVDVEIFETLDTKDAENLARILLKLI